MYLWLGSLGEDSTATAFELAFEYDTFLESLREPSTRISVLRLLRVSSSAGIT